MYKMQSNKKTLSSALLATAVISTTNAFTLSQYSAVSCSNRLFIRTPSIHKKTGLSMAGSVEDEVAALRAAAAKAREDAQRLAKEMGKEIDFSTNTSSSTATKTPPKSKASPEEIEEVAKSLTFQPDNVALQASTLDKLVDDGKFTMWKSAQRGSANTNSATPLRPYPVSLNFLESRTNGKVTSESLGTSQVEISMKDFQDTTIIVVGASSVLAIGSLALLPENVGPTLCYLFALIPVIFLGIGSSAPGIIAGAIGLTKGTRDDEETKIDRICRHEAAHFLCGYICGLPVVDYSITDTGVPCVEFYPTSKSEDNIATREFTQEEIATLSVVSMSGSVGEVLKFDVAKGGDNDLIQLNQYFKRSSEFLGAQKQQDLTRWGALSAYNILQGNYKAYEKLIEAFKDKKSVNECIQIIESTV